MAFVLADRVQETTTTTGTGTITLAGQTTAMRTFASGVGTSNSTGYCILDGNGIDWESGYGSVGGGGTTLSRDTILASSNSNSAISLTSGPIHTVFCTLPGSHATYLTNELLYTLGAPVGNSADTSNDTLATYVLPGGTLAASGYQLRIKAIVNRGSVTTNTTNFTVTFGSTTCMSVSTTTSGINGWQIETTIVKDGTNSQFLCMNGVRSNAVINNTAAQQSVAGMASGVETDGSNITITASGQNATSAVANSVILKAFTIELLRPRPI